MRIEIHRTLMALPPTPHGLRAVSYCVYVPLEECQNQSTGYTVLCREDRPQTRQVMDFPNATWIPDCEIGWERYSQWLKHEQAATQLMLSWITARCPETRGMTRWPLLWVYVNISETPASAFTEPTTFEWEPVHVPGSPTLANYNRHLPETQQRRASRATCQAQNHRSWRGQ